MSKIVKDFTFMADPAYYVTSVKQLLVLAKPGREDIIDAIAVRGPSTVPEIAAFLGRTRNSLYYHVDVLAKAGLLVEETVRRQGIKSTARYDLPGRPMIVKYDLSTPRNRRAVIRLGLGRFHAGKRSFVRACNSELAVAEGPRRNLWISYWEGWLSDDELHEANRILNSLVDLYRRSSKSGGGGRKPYALTFGIAPVIGSKKSE